jgi:hypothetical protein
VRLVFYAKVECVSLTKKQQQQQCSTVELFELLTLQGGSIVHMLELVYFRILSIYIPVWDDIMISVFSAYRPRLSLDSNHNTWLIILGIFLSRARISSSQRKRRCHCLSSFIKTFLQLTWFWFFTLPMVLKSLQVYYFKTWCTFVACMEKSNIFNYNIYMYTCEMHIESYSLNSLVMDIIIFLV